MWPFRRKCIADSKTQNRPDLEFQHNQILQKLIHLGYLKFVPDRDHERIKAEILTCMKQRLIDSAWDVRGVAHDRRSYPIDIEDLAHGGIGKLVTLMKDVLAVEGVRLESVVDDYRKVDEKIHYQVLVNSQRFPVGWDEIDDDNLRRFALQTLLNIGNHLLRQADSKEHLVGIGRNNAIRAMFLTQEMMRYLYPLPEVEFRWITAGDLFAC
jgi:hypothetical protein